MKKYSLAVLISMLFSSLALASDSAAQQEAMKTLQQAIAKTNIFELPSFQMKASVQIESQGKPLDGTYQLLWNGPEQWREEISFPGYNEVQVGGKGTVWIQRSTDFLPLRIYQLHEALGFGSGVAASGSGRAWSFVELGLTPEDQIKRVRSRKEHKDRLTCVEIEDEQKRSSDICVNEASGIVVRDDSYEDGDFQPVGVKIFPRFLSFVEDGKGVAKVNISEVATPAQFSQSAFAPPTGVSPQDGCMNPSPFRVLKKVVPVYPEQARRAHAQGTVAVDAWIGRDGVPKLGKIVRHASAELEKSSMDALPNWRYQPATCDGKAVDVETVVRVNYTLSP